MIKINEKKLISTSEKLFLSLPILLITGPLLPEIAMNLFTILLLIVFFKNRIYFNFFKKNKYFYVLFSFYFLLVFSSLISEISSYSIKSSILYFRFILFALFASWIIENNFKLLNYFIKIILYCVLILVFFALIEYLFDFNIMTGDKIRSNRISSLFGDELILGSYLSKFLPFLICILFLDKKKKNNILTFFYLSIIFLALFSVFISGERTALFLTFVSVFLIFINTIDYFKIKFTLIVLFVISIILSINFGSKLKTNIFDRTYNQIVVDGKIRYFSKEHEVLTLTAWNIFKDNKFFGTGPKTFRYVCKDDLYLEKTPYSSKENQLQKEKRKKEIKYVYGCSTHPHNLYAQLLSEIGIFGFGFVMFLFLLISYSLIKNIFIILIHKKQNMNIYSLTSTITLFIILFPFIPSGNFFNNFLSISHYLIFSIFLATNKKNV